MKVARTVLNGESGNNAADLHNIKMVYYHYNKGSRSSDAAKSFLEYFMGTISTDGYTVYRMYDGEKSRVLHIGCRTHCRRIWIDVLPSDRSAMDIIEFIGEIVYKRGYFPYNGTQP